MVPGGATCHGLTMIERSPSSMPDRVRVDGKFFRLGVGKFYVKGFCYGPFAPNSHGEHLPEPEQLLADFRQIRQLGANTIRLYSVPSSMILDEALEHNIRVIIDVP